MLSDEIDKIGSQYRCDFSNGTCNWAATIGKMKWTEAEERTARGPVHYMKMDMSRYFSNDLVTVGQLRSPDMTPPPYYNDDATSAETFQSCSLRLYLKIEGNVDRVDMFEIEVVENIPLTKVKLSL